MNPLHRYQLSVFLNQVSLMEHKLLSLVDVFRLLTSLIILTNFQFELTLQSPNEQNTISETCICNNATYCSVMVVLVIECLLMS
jgi:hypothetical protein